MRKVWLSLVSIATFVVAGLVGMPAAQAAGANYVALGDSYASGVGAGSYTSASGSCLRSTLAYPQLWANSHAPASFKFVACSGAKTTDVKANQLSALSPSTTLVSITIGGNDVGFSSVMTDCASTATQHLRQPRSTRRRTSARTKLPALLDTTVQRHPSRAPNARVVVAGLPALLSTSAAYCVGLIDHARQDQRGHRRARQRASRRPRRGTPASRSPTSAPASRRVTRSATPATPGCTRSTGATSATPTTRPPPATPAVTCPRSPPSAVARSPAHPPATEGSISTSARAGPACSGPRSGGRPRRRCRC